VEGVGTTGTPIVSEAPLGLLAALAWDGGTTLYPATGDAGAAASYTLGIATDAAGNIYTGVAAAAAPPNNPPPGTWTSAVTGGATVLFSAAGAVSPAMNFANGLDFMGANLFVADSEGVVYKIDATGTATVWSQDPLLAPDQKACGGLVPLPVGANGI